MCDPLTFPPFVFALHFLPTINLIAFSDSTNSDFVFGRRPDNRCYASERCECCEVLVRTLTHLGISRCSVAPCYQRQRGALPLVCDRVAFTAASSTATPFTPRHATPRVECDQCLQNQHEYPSSLPPLLCAARSAASPAAGDRVGFGGAAASAGDNKWMPLFLTLALVGSTLVLSSLVWRSISRTFPR